MIFDKLTNLQLIFCYSLQLIFCQYCRLIFSDIFWKNIFTWYFCNLFFCYSLQLILGQSFRIIFLANHVNLFFWYFLQQFFPLIFLQICFAILCRIIFSTPCKAQLNLQNLEANLQILLILYFPWKSDTVSYHLETFSWQSLFFFIFSNFHCKQIPFNHCPWSMLSIFSAL